MIKNYLKTAWRNLLRQKGFSLINIFGLASGMACSLLIFLYVADENSYDRFNKNSETIYRVVKDFVNDDGTKLPDATTPPALAPALQNEIPEVVHTTRVYPSWGRNFLIQSGKKKITDEKVYRVDSSFFDVFTVPFIYGDPKSAFKEVNSVIITASTAKRFFGDDNPMGEIIKLDQLGDMAVTGVINDIPENSHFHFDFLISVRKFSGNIDGNWGWYNYYTYIKTEPGTNVTNLTSKIQEIYKKNNDNGTNIFHVQALNDIHLTSSLKWELEPNGDRQSVNIFALVAIFILLIAGINYVNLSTAKASVRAKEVGVRKVAGAFKSSLIKQFLVESMVTCFIAAVLAVLIAQLLLPAINQLTAKHLNFISDLRILSLLFATALSLGLLAGIFPALYLSSFRPIIVLKGFKLKENRTLSLRKGLVVLQFTISIVLIIGALIISQQMGFIQSAKLGIDKEQVLIVKNAEYLSRTDQNAFQNSVRQLAGVKSIATADGVVGGQNWTSSMRWKENQSSSLINFLSVGTDYFNTLNIKVKEGRGFSTEFPADTLNNGVAGPLEQTIGSIVLNETAVKNMGIPEPAVGQQIYWSSDADTSYYTKVIGVVKDFHFTSFKSEIKPFAFVRIPQRVENFTMKLSTNDIKGTLANLENTWKKFSSERPFQYYFLDETYDNLYKSESRFQKVFISLVILGIIIACLGLFGLSTFAAQQRIKEIGIRKVLGASVSGITGLLSRDFLRLVVVALILAIPIAWYALSKWLEDFAYRINISWWIFLLAAVISLLIAFITVGFQAVKAAIANPVKSLRTE